MKRESADRSCSWTVKSKTVQIFRSKPAKAQGNGNHLDEKCSGMPF